MWRHLTTRTIVGAPRPANCQLWDSVDAALEPSRDGSSAVEDRQPWSRAGPPHEALHAFPRSCEELNCAPYRLLTPGGKTKGTDTVLLKGFPLGLVREAVSRDDDQPSLRNYGHPVGVLGLPRHLWEIRMAGMDSGRLGGSEDSRD